MSAKATVRLSNDLEADGLPLKVRESGADISAHVSNERSRVEGYISLAPSPDFGKHVGVSHPPFSSSLRTPNTEVEERASQDRLATEIDTDAVPDGWARDQGRSLSPQIGEVAAGWEETDHESCREKRADNIDPTDPTRPGGGESYR